LKLARNNIVIQQNKGKSIGSELISSCGMSSSKFLKKIRSLAVVSVTGTLLFGGLNFYRNDEQFFDKVAMPLTRLLDPEQAHRLAVFACKWKILPAVKYEDPKSLVSES